MKVLVLNGSPNKNGCTGAALDEVIRTLEKEGIETEVVHVGNKDIRGCIACNKCAELGKCVFDDLVNETAPKFEEADGLIIGSPVYWGSPNGTPRTNTVCLNRRAAYLPASRMGCRI